MSEKVLCDVCGQPSDYFHVSRFGASFDVCSTECLSKLARNEEAAGKSGVMVLLVAAVVAVLLSVV